MARVNVYLTFNGNCEEAFNFYKSVFGGDFPYMGRFGEMPSSEQNQVSAEHANRIMHVSLPVSKETVIMGSDTAGEWANDFKQGNNFSISINADSRDEADRLFSGLSADGVIVMPMNQTFWGDYFGMFTDKFGVNWMVSFDTRSEGSHA